MAYGGPLRFPASPRPYVIANFVASIDGVASLGLTDGTDSTTLSGGSRADRYLMGLLRASVDVVIIGAGTLRSTPGHQWTPAAVAGDDAAAIDAYRFERTGADRAAAAGDRVGERRSPRTRRPRPSGDQRRRADLGRRGREGARSITRSRSVIEVGEQDGVGGAGVVTAVTRAMGAGLLLCEGGPSLFGRLMADRVVHELFLTISPRIAGRDHAEPRPGIVDGWAAASTALPTARIDSVRRSDDHLFLRYRFQA